MESVLPVENIDIKYLEGIESGEIDIESMTAEEFMAYTRYQADSMPDYTRADIDPVTLGNKQTRYMPEIARIDECSDRCLPIKEWEEAVLEDFIDLREVFSLFY
jgi:hypothetical protein